MLMKTCFFINSLRFRLSLMCLVLYEQLKESENKIEALSRERDQLIKQKDSALQEAHLWRSELAKARERAVILEAAVLRAEEKVRVTDADAEARIQDAEQKESAAAKDKQELLAYVNMLQTQLKRSSCHFCVSKTSMIEQCCSHVLEFIVQI